MKARILLLVVVLFAAIACKTDSCSKEEYLDGLEPIHDQWGNLVNEINHVGLDAPIGERVPLMAELVNVLDEVTSFKPPQCSELAHAKFIEHVYLGREGFMAAWQGDKDAAMVLINRSLIALDEWETLVGEMER